MPKQTILFTAMPRAISLNPETMPVSVYVSPRLFGDGEQAKLGEFPDWLNWTGLVEERGLTLTFRCEGVDTTVAVNRKPLRPELWQAMFKDSTLVRSHTFDDYSGHTIVSYSVRSVLSLLKNLYQKAGIELALPDVLFHFRPDDYPLVNPVSALVDGFAVPWDDTLREQVQSGQGLLKLRELLGEHGNRDSEGLFVTTSLSQDNLKDVREAVGKEFAVFHHIPPGQAIKDNPLDFDTLLDFHQVLSSLNSYSDLLRALGLVFDFELPKEAVPLTPEPKGTLGVVAAQPGWEWNISTSIAPLETCYSNSDKSGNREFKTVSNRDNETVPDNETIHAQGLLRLDPRWFGLAQVDVDGGMHKTMMLAATVQDKLDEAGQRIDPPVPLRPEVFDPSATLPSLRSGGFSLFSDRRVDRLQRSFKQSKLFQEATAQQQPQPSPFYEEDLIHGYRFDIWDSHTNQWHSLHKRNSTYKIADKEFAVKDEEGFTELAATQPPPNPENPPAKDLYLHEAMARWAGWSLSVPFPGKVLSSDPDPKNALTQAAEDQNVPATPFKMTTNFKIVGNSLPSLRFGRRYRIRARAVDICGNSVKFDDLNLAGLSDQCALPPDPEGFAYLRYEPVTSPQIVPRDARCITDPGSQLDCLVIRTFNSDPSKDADAADLTASDRHILPPRTSVELAERMGMLDDAKGKLSPSETMYRLLATKDGAELNQVRVQVGERPQAFPLESSDRIDKLVYLPDVLARAAALRDLPGTPSGTLGTVKAGATPPSSVDYIPLEDPHPRPGSATLISFGGEGDWQTTQPFRLALAEGSSAPEWDGQNRVLTVYLPKGTSATVPLTSALHADDLNLMGVWQWLREYIDKAFLDTAAFTSSNKDDLAKLGHIVQRAVEGGHWMLTPPHLLTLVHAVQQPLGVPTFQAIPVQHEPYDEEHPEPAVLQTAPEVGVTRVFPDLIAPNPTELAAITAWRKLGSTDAYLLGGLHIHASSTAKVDILAEWEDKVDDLTEDNVDKFTKDEVDQLTKKGYRTVSHATPVDEIPLQQVQSHFVKVTPDARAVAYYAADQDLLCFTRENDHLGHLSKGLTVTAAAPRHQLNDTRHHRIRYTARATSRYRDYFSQNEALDFSRPSASIVVDVPASARPPAPQIAYVVPTFGWQRQTQTNLKRSVRFGGLRVYLERPWYSSGDGELLGVTLYPYNGDTMADDLWKSLTTQFGRDPIWQAGGDVGTSTFGSWNLTDWIAEENALTLEENSQKKVDVVGYPVAYDEERNKWYSDLTIDVGDSYMPFVRLALVRYQPCALADAKLSRVVLADFAQLTNNRACVVTADPYHPRQLRVTVSGVRPEGPMHKGGVDVQTPPTKIFVEVQIYDDSIDSDLAWVTVDSSLAKAKPGDPSPADPLVLWTGTVEFTEPPSPGSFRLLIREYEFFKGTDNKPSTAAEREKNPLLQIADAFGLAPPRIVYAETVPIDAALVSQVPPDDRRTKLEEV